MIHTLFRQICLLDARGQSLILMCIMVIQDQKVVHPFIVQSMTVVFIVNKQPFVIKSKGFFTVKIVVTNNKKGGLRNPLEILLGQEC